jgi:hypothetical protein
MLYQLQLKPGLYQPYRPGLRGVMFAQPRVAARFYRFSRAIFALRPPQRNEFGPGPCGQSSNTGSDQSVCLRSSRIRRSSHANIAHLSDCNIRETTGGVQELARRFPRFRWKTLWRSRNSVEMGGKETEPPLVAGYVLPPTFFWEASACPHRPAAGRAT